MKNKKLVVLLSALVLATAPAVVAVTGCSETPNTPNNPDNPPVVTTDEYTFKFVGGTGATGTAPADIKKKNEETFTFPANTFTKPGYTFAGWKNGSEVKQPGDSYTVGTEGKTFTADWTANDYKVTFAGGEGATGEVADITGKHIGDKVTLPENEFVNEGYDFAGWSVGGEVKQPGDEITIGTENVTVTATWEEVVPEFEEGDYVDNVKESGITAKFEDGKVTITALDWQDNPLTTVYDYSVEGTTVTFTDAEGTEYTGTYINDVLTIAVPVRASAYAVNSTVLILTKEVLTLHDDMGDVNGYSQTLDFSDYIYMFTDGSVIVTHDETVNYRKTYTAKYGTYTADGNHVYTISYEGDAKTYEMKITLNNGVSFYAMSDGYKGEYTFGSTKVNLDGYGKWANGTYELISDGTNAMIYLVDTEELTENLCSVSDNTLTEITNEKAGKYTTKDEYPAIEKIVFNGTNLAGLYYSDEGGNTHVAAFAVTESKLFTVNIDYTDYSIMLMANGVFQVKGQYSSSFVYYTLNGGEIPATPAPTTDLEEGDYVDNLDSTISAKIENTAEGTILTLKKGSSADAVYQVTAGETEGTYTFTQIRTSSQPTVATGYIVNNVLVIAYIKASTSTVSVALSTTALEKIDNVSNGYVNNPSSSTYKLYLFKNNLAVYFHAYARAKAGTYTVSGNEYTVTFFDNTTNSFKVTLDEGTTKATYIIKDAFAKTYTLDGKSYVLDGYGNCTVDGNECRYISGALGFTILNADGTVNNVYKVTDDTIAEATETDTKNNAGGNTNTALTAKGINFKTAEVYTGCGCAVISYTITEGETEGEVQTVKVAVGVTFTVGDENFTVTKVADDSVTIQRTNTEGVASNAKNLTFGIAG